MRTLLYFCLLSFAACAPSITNGFDQASYQEKLAVNLKDCGEISPPYEAYMNCLGAAELSAGRASGASQVLLSEAASHARKRTAVAARVDRGELTENAGLQEIRFLQEEFFNSVAAADANLKAQYRERLKLSINQYQENQQRQAVIDALNRPTFTRPTNTRCTTNYGVTNCTTF